MPTQVRCKDGHYATTGVPPRPLASSATCSLLLDRLGLRDEFPLSPILELGVERERINFADIETDPMIAEILGAAREVLWFLAEHMSGSTSSSRPNASASPRA